MDKRNVVLMFLAIIVIAAVIWRACQNKSNPLTSCQYNFPSYNPDYPPPAGTPPTEIFQLSQDYPDSFSEEFLPWTAIDFRNEPQAYAQAVLAYCLEGNVPVDFRVQQNAVRKWFHAPWLHYGPKGREWHRGLTLERSSRSGELHPNQTSPAASWAVGFYNDRGGYTIGKVWGDCGNGLPDPRKSVFPEGAVAFKLLFSSASDTQVPYLQNSLSWLVNIGTIGGPRSDRTMRLLQMDIAVKDQRSPIGWVFGTFVYDGFATGNSPFERLQLVGLSWGNDPTVTSRMADNGAFINADLRESYINPALIPSGTTVNEARVYHVGLGGRLNGPVDNPVSSCTSCHGKASVLKELHPNPIENIGRMPRMIPRAVNQPSQMTIPKFNDFFGINIPPGTDDILYNCYISGLDATCTSPNPMYEFIKTDYSLQVAEGIENYYSSIQQRATEFIQQNMNSPHRQ
jgi:hypothetical protein